MLGGHFGLGGLKQMIDLAPERTRTGSLQPFHALIDLDSLYKSTPDLHVTRRYMYGYKFLFAGPSVPSASMHPWAYRLSP